MNKSVDVIKELAVKNKEIYLNKLDIDLTNNQENLFITIKNIIDLFTKEVTTKVLEIETNTLLFSYASQEVTNFHNFLCPNQKQNLFLSYVIFIYAAVNLQKKFG